MMKLFDETKNHFFQFLCQLINEIHSGCNYTKNDILHRLQQVPEFSSAVDLSEETAIIQHLFHFNDKDQYAELFIDEPVPCMPSNLELSWLKTMLEDDSCTFLLSDKLHRKMEERLKNVPALIPKGYWKKIHDYGDDTTSEPMKSYLRIILQAFRQQKQIHYINKDAQAYLHEDTVAPCRLEYDLAADKYRLIIWNSAENRAVKINMANLQALSLTQIPFPPDLTQKLNDFYAAHQTTITLRLINKVNAVERCFALFAAYDKESIVDETLHTYTLKITGYDFDRGELRDKILSLGSAVTVIEPSELRQEIISCLQTAARHYIENPSISIS